MKIVWVLVLLITSQCVAIVSGQDDSLFESEQFGIALANGTSWRKYDVLIKEATFVREELGSSELQKSEFPKSFDRSIRLAIDWDEKIVFCLSKTQSTLQLKELFDLELIAKSKEFSRWVRYPGGKRRLEPAEMLMILMKPGLTVPDIRFVGMQPFPIAFNEGFDQQVATFQTMPSSDNVKVSRTHDTIQVAINGGESTIVRLYDVKSLMMKQMYIRLKKDGRMFLDQEISWIEKDGVFLPVSIIGEKYKPNENVTQFSSVSIMWRSVNEMLNPSLFDAKVLDDVKGLEGLVDEDLFKRGGCLNRD